jgi:N,N'-diacetylbacillosaminyl-diphospho-undecaprenol alpha-1,3-N-acetylgalactosaminyltransferase
MPVRLTEIKSNLNTLDPFVELQNIAALNLAIRDFRPDLIHSFTIKPNLYSPALARLAGVRGVICMVTGFGSVMIANGFRHRLLRSVVKRIYRWSFRFADRIVVTNSDDYALCLDQKFARAEALQVIPGAGVDVARFAPKSGPDNAATRARFDIDPDNVNVLFVGRMTREKGLQDLCEAFRTLKQDNIRLHLVGEIDSKNPSALDPEQYGKMDKRIVYHGRMDGLERLFAVVDIVALPSYREGMPTVLMEAAAAGLPAVATDVPGCREAVIDGATGLLVQAGDQNALAEALGKLAGNAELRKEFGENARVHAAQFDKAKVVEDTIAIYRNLVSSD